MTLVAKTKGVMIPRRVDSGMLEKLGKPGEGRVVVKMAGIGNVAPYEFRGHDSRAFVLRWEPKMTAHVLRVPLSLWMQNGHRMAHDLLDHHRLESPMVVMFEEGVAGEGWTGQTSQTSPTSPTSQTTQTSLTVAERTRSKGRGKARRRKRA